MKIGFKMKLVLPIVLVFFTLAGIAQTSPEQMVETFFINYEKDGASIALDNLYSTNKWMSRAKDAIENLKNQLEGLNEDFVGKYYGYELIVEKRLSESYVLLSYLVKYERQPIRFTFQFYKPNDVWLIYSFQFDGDIDKEIEEAAKLNHL